ncbi:sulfite exporter TauE/SafE family protein [Paenibacillus tarimensis]
MDYQLSFEIIALLVAAGFLAAFIDSVVGGGGIISVPALLLAGLPPGIALGTNKLASTMSSLTSAASFYISGKVEKRMALLLFPFAFAGSIIGAYVITFIPAEFLRPLVVLLLILMTLYTLFKKNLGRQTVAKRISFQLRMLITILVLIIGFYDGFFGPGTGSFFIFLMIYAGFDFVKAAGNAKVLNFGSNLAGLLTFAALNHVNYIYGLIMGVSMVFGALIGSRLAISTGVTYVRYLFIIVTVLLIGTQIWYLIRA